MNTINFSSPQGFPLEADRTLGAMQNDYQSAIKGLADWFDNMTIVSGLKSLGGTVLSDGYIYIGGDLVFFQGGNELSTFYIEISTVQKANENGVLVDRYITKKARFGTSNLHEQFNFSDLKRAPDVNKLKRLVTALCSQENEPVIISGCFVDVNANTISNGVVYIENEVYFTPPYSGSFPVYLKIDNSTLNGVSYTTVQPSGTYIVFDPHTSQRYLDVMRRLTAYKGEIRQLVTTSDRFDSTGLGRWELKGFAQCNGNNGTVNLSGRTLFGFDSTDNDFMQNQGGSKTVTLIIENMPPHNHFINDPVIPGSYGLIRRTTSGQSRTASAADAINSGSEPDIISPPAGIPEQGNSTPFKILPPYQTVFFIQKI